MPAAGNGRPTADAHRDRPVAVSRCLVVDDHPALRLGVAQLLDAEPDLKVVATYETAEEALGYALRHPVDVAVVDHQLGGRSGLWLSRRLRPRATPPRVVIYSAHTHHLLAAACVVAEASALVGKAALGEQLIAAIRDVGRGRARPPQVPPMLADSIGRRLDHEQQAIFGLMANGASAAEVATTLRLPEFEVDERLGQMLSLLQPQRSQWAA